MEHRMRHNGDVTVKVRNKVLDLEKRLEDSLAKAKKKENENERLRRELLDKVSDATEKVFFKFLLGSKHCHDEPEIPAET